MQELYSLQYVYPRVVFNLRHTGMYRSYESLFLKSLNITWVPFSVKISLNMGLFFPKLWKRAYILRKIPENGCFFLLNLSKRNLSTPCFTQLAVKINLGILSSSFFFFHFLPEAVCYIGGFVDELNILHILISMLHLLICM